MARIVSGIFVVGLALAPLTLGVNAQGTQEEEMARCRMAMKFWPKPHLDGLAYVTRTDAERAPDVACDRVVAGVLAGRIKSGDFSLKTFAQGSNPELTLVLAGR